MIKVLRGRTITLLELLPTDVAQRLLSAGRLRAYKAGQAIQDRGEERQSLSIVRSGQVLAGNLGLDGTFLASALLYPGDCFGEITLFTGLPRTQNLWAQGETEIVDIGKRPFMDLFASEPAIPLAMMKISQLRSYELIEFLDALRRLSLLERLARLLLAAIEPGAKCAMLECRQEDIAFMLGVSRVSVGKALKRLQADGLIALGYGRIQIESVADLAARVKADAQLLPILSRE